MHIYTHLFTQNYMRLRMYKYGFIFLFVGVNEYICKFYIYIYMCVCVNLFNYYNMLIYISHIYFNYNVYYIHL